MKASILLFFLVLFSLKLFAEAGVIVPAGRNYPDNKILYADKMRVDVKIDSLYANVKIMQIFKNNKYSDIEGEYIFTMPDNAMISNFAIWEDGNRIKGVIMEKSKARRLYEKIKARLIDPGLLEQKDNFSVNKFKVNVYPIPANGYKRIEIEYTQLLGVNFNTSTFRLPLKPVLFKKFINKINKFEFNLSYNSNEPQKETIIIAPFDYKNNSSYNKNNNMISFSYKGKNVVLDKDFVFSVLYDLNETHLDFKTYRDIDKVRTDYSPSNDKRRYKDDTGFFKADFYLNENLKNDKTLEKKKIVILFDRSLSMKWLKLSKSLEIFKKVLNGLHGEDEFKLFVFSNDIEYIYKDFVKAEDKNLKNAYEKLLNFKIKNGTDLLKLAKLLQKEEKGTYVYWITDGQATLNEINDKNLLKEFLKLKKLKFFILGVGFDSNKRFLEKIADSTAGYYLHFFENEDIALKMKLFFKAVNQIPLYGLKYAFDNPKNFKDIYVINNLVYDKSVYSLTGKYLRPMKSKISLTYKNAEKEKEFKVDLPEKSVKNEYIKKIWAKARIDYLLNLIDDKGEKKEWIDEIIALSKEFTIVTPYTSFLAAPRSLIRPRSIIPGDPVLRVKTDDTIKSVIAKFEFGLTKKLKFIPKKGIWETRFLVPYYLKDGKYKVDLFLTQKDGSSIIERKYITIDSTPPILKKRYVVENGNLKLIVDASKDTKKIYAYVGDEIVEIKYDKKLKHSIGYLSNAQRFENRKIKFILEDFAHNTSTFYDVVKIGE